MVLKTHKKFKSFVLEVKDAKAIDDLVGEVLLYDFEIKTPLWEVDDWPRDELANFKIDLERVDRLYYIARDVKSKRDTRYDLVCRMDYRGKSIFIALKANREFNLIRDGTILISANAKCFIKSILPKVTTEMLFVYQALANDGVEMCEYMYAYEMCYFDVKRGGYPFNEEFTHFKPEEIRETISSCSERLSEFLQNNLNELIEYAENRIHIGDWW